jgi:membrane-bound lytic murein transglycosylase D
VRWDARLVRYLEMYKDDPRARGALVIWRRRAGRYKDQVADVLRRKRLPQDLVWLAMIESGFDPAARSPAGALGMWQFMPETGRIYGLPQDRWVDERLDVTAATEAAADFLGDLYHRFGNWDLAMASYNMGYAGVVVAERRYNTNDFWQLSKLEGSLPWETTLYVPKILAAAIVMHNPKVFGMDGITPEAAIESEQVRAPFGVSLSAIAQASGVAQKDLEQLNPELRASRTPPKESDAAQAVLAQSSHAEGQTPGWPLRVPVGRASTVVAAMSRLKHDDTALERYVVRFGETLDQIAQAHGTTSSKLSDINAIGPGELVRGGTLLLVPPAPPPKKTAQAAAKTAPTASADPDADKPVAVVPQDLFVYPGRKRVFYKVLVGDKLDELAGAMHVTVDELARWNDLDPSARLQEGMTLQAFVPDGADLSKISLLAENDVRVLTAGTDEFFAYWEKTRRRVVVPAHAGDTIDVIGKRYGVSGAAMERINRRSRREVLKDGDTVVVYVDPKKAPNQAAGQAQDGASLPGAGALPDPEPLGPLPAAPHPELLPKVD